MSRSKNMFNRKTQSTTIAVALIFTAPSSRADSYFARLGPLPGHTWSTAIAVSPDGQTVLGWSANDSDFGAYFRWTRAGGLEELPFSWEFRPDDVANDGRLGGTARTLSDYFYFSQAARWSESAGLELFGVLNNDCESRGHAISASGDTIVGESFGDSGQDTYPCTLPTPVRSGANNLRALHCSAEFNVGGTAYDISADGQAIVGRVFGSENWQFVIWREGDQDLELGRRPDGYFSECSISGDGTTVLAGDRFRWSEATGWSEFEEFSAERLNYDGSRAAGATERGPAIWDQTTGVLYIAPVLIQCLGFDLSGFSLYRASDISGDGMTVVGTGCNSNGRSEGWVARLEDSACPSPPPCAGDVDDDGSVGLSDLAAVLSVFGIDVWAQPCFNFRTDLNADNQVDLSDLSVLLAHFGIVCN